MTTETGTYELATDRSRGVLSFQVIGMLAESDGRRFFDECVQAAKRMGPNPWVTLADVRGAPPLPQVEEGVKAAMQVSAEQGCVKVGLVVSMASTQMYVKRLGNASGATSDGAMEIRFFSTMEETLDWLGLEPVT